MSDPTEPTFTSATFLAHLSGSTFNLTDKGLNFKVFVEPESVEAALPLRYLITNPLPIEVTVKIYEPYVEEETEDDRRIRELMGLGD
jgi:hypothetical protein